MEKARQKFDALIEEGEAFTFENFSTKSRHGYPDAYTPEWVAWRARVQNLIPRLTGRDSAPAEMVKEANRVSVIGNGADKFELAKSHYMGALSAAVGILDDDLFEERSGGGAVGPGVSSDPVFIVHGHDDSAKNELEALLGEMGLDPIVLHRKPDEGMTVIEKFEKYSDVGFAFIILTPDEVAYLAAEEELPEQDRVKERRARPNVIFEFGYFVGRLGRESVCCLYTGDVVLPSDVGGMLYKPFRESVEEVAWSIAKELQARGYSLATPGEE